RPPRAGAARRPGPRLDPGAPAGRPRRGPGAGGPPALPVHDRAREPAAGRPRPRGAGARGGLPGVRAGPVPGTEGPRDPARGLALRRRAADVRDRPRPHGAAAAAHAGRAHPRHRPGAGAAHLRDGGRDQSRRRDRPAGRAERPPRAGPRPPRGRAGERPGGPGRPRPGAAGRRAAQEGLPRDVTGDVTADRRALRIDRLRLAESMDALGRIGGTARGGLHRVALTDDDRRGRDLLVRWMREAGLQVSVDQMGNIFGIRPGTEARPPVFMGSHADSVPSGGRYDGQLGVLCALETLRTLNDHRVATRHPVGMIVFTNEEGARFQPAMIASGVMAGKIPLEDAYNARDRDGIRLVDALERIGYLGSEPCVPRPMRAYLE